MPIIVAPKAPRKCAVYLVRNTTNGKSYVGKTVDIDRRWREHLTQARRKSALMRAIAKHGAQAFDFDVLEWFDSEADALWWESWWVQYLGTKKPHGYNIADGGRGAVGVEWTKDRRQRISQALTGKKLSDAHRRALSESHKGQRPSPESVEKGRQKNIGRKRSPEARQRMSDRQRGKPKAAWTSERREKMLKRALPADWRSKLSEALKGKPWTEARRAAQASVSMARTIAARHRTRGTIEAAKAPLITVGAETLTRGAWAMRSGLTVEQIKNRIAKGWTEAEAVTIPVGGRRQKAG